MKLYCDGYVNYVRCDMIALQRLRAFSKYVTLVICVTHTSLRKKNQNRILLIVAKKPVLKL